MNGKIKKIQASVLTGLVWGAYRFGKAAEKLEEKSVYAFGDASNQWNLNLHHTLSRESYPDVCDEDASDNEIVTVQVHQLLHNANRDLKAGEEFLNLEKFSVIMSQECPNETVVLETDAMHDKQTGEKTHDGKSRIYSIANEKIMFTDKAVEDLQKLQWIPIQQNKKEI